MRRKEEIESPDSCLNKAADDEPIFVLRAKDAVAVDAVGYWIGARVRAGLDREGSEKLLGAYRWMGSALAWREKNGLEK